MHMSLGLQHLVRRQGQRTQIVPFPAEGVTALLPDEVRAIVPSRRPLAAHTRELGAVGSEFQYYIWTL